MDTDQRINRPRVQAPLPAPGNEAEEAPQMRKYENSGVLYENTNRHPRAPIMSGPCTIGGVKYRAKIFRNLGRAKDGGDVITVIFESKEQGGASHHE